MLSAPLFIVFFFSLGLLEVRAVCRLTIIITPQIIYKCSPNGAPTLYEDKKECQISHNQLWVSKSMEH